MCLIFLTLLTFLVFDILSYVKVFFIFGLIIRGSINFDSRFFGVEDSSAKTNSDKVKIESFFKGELFSIEFSRFGYFFSWFLNFSSDINFGVEWLSYIFDSIPQYEKPSIIYSLESFLNLEYFGITLNDEILSLNNVEVLKLILL